MRVVLVEDEVLVRKGLARWLSDASVVEVCGEASDSRECLDICSSQHIDVAIIDVNLPGLSGIELVRALRGDFPKVSALMVSGPEAPSLVLDAFQAGARGYLTKGASPSELGFALSEIGQGKAYLSSAITSKVMDYAISLKNKVREVEPNSEQIVLNERERELLKLISEGHTFSEIASMLSINPRSVERLKSRLLGKLDAENIADLIKFAVKVGIVKA